MLGKDKMKIVLFRYRDETPDERILRHHRIARWIIYPCGFFSLAMFSSIAQGLVFEFDTITMGIMVVSLCGVALLIVPALFCIPWIRDAEAVLVKRSIPIPGGVEIEKRIARTTGKLILWAIGIVMAPVLVRKLIAMLTQH